MYPPEGCEWSSWESFNNALAVSLPEPSKPSDSSQTVALPSAALYDSAGTYTRNVGAGVDRGAQWGSPTRQEASREATLRGQGSALPGTSTEGALGRDEAVATSGAKRGAATRPPTSPAEAAEAGGGAGGGGAVRGTSREVGRTSCGSAMDGQALRRLQDGGTTRSGAVGTAGSHLSPVALTQRPFRTAQGRTSVLEMPHLACGERLVALDCEMCITQEGFEVTRVSVVDQTGKVWLQAPVSVFALPMEQPMRRPRCLLSNLGTRPSASGLCVD